MSLGQIEVNGKNAHPLHRALTRTPDGDGKAGRVAWNFEKFLVNPNGRIERFRPRILPDAPKIVATITEWTAEPNTEGA